MSDYDIACLIRTFLVLKDMYVDYDESPDVERIGNDICAAAGAKSISITPLLDRLITGEDHLISDDYTMPLKEILALVWEAANDDVDQDGHVCIDQENNLYCDNTPLIEHRSNLVLEKLQELNNMNLDTLPTDQIAMELLLLLKGLHPLVSDEALEFSTLNQEFSSMSFS